MFSLNNYTTSFSPKGWLSKKEDGPYNINYKADSNQLSFLQLLSGRAAQTITFHCRNTIAYRSPRVSTSLQLICRLFINQFYEISIFQTDATIISCHDLTFTLPRGTRGAPSPS